MFFAECPFCHVKLQKVPDHREGDSTECPRCHNLFTLTVMISPPKSREQALRAGVAKRAAASPAAAVSSTATSSSANHEVLHVRPALPEQPAAAGVGTLVKPATATVPPVVDLPAFDMPALPGPRSGQGAAVAALLLGGLAVCSATLLHLFFLTLILAGAGGICAVVVIVSTPPRQSAPATAKFGLLVSSAVLILSFLWPGLLGIPTTSGSKDLTEGGGSITVIAGLQQGKGKRSSAEEPPLVDASRGSIEQDGLRVQIVSVELKRAEIADDKAKKSAPDKNLLISVRVTNLGITHDVVYSSWGEAGPFAATLKDTRGAGYRLQTLGAGVEIVGHISRGTLAPGKAVDDVLVYPASAAQAEKLYVELPATALGLPGLFRFEIPRRMIVLK
jgi:hypothetical protein